MTDQERAFELVGRLHQLGIFAIGRGSPDTGGYRVEFPVQSFDKLDALITNQENINKLDARLQRSTPARHRDDYDPEPDYSRPTRYDIGPDGQV